MERSGLYKKLNTLIDKSPSLFIRSIRLRRAADLIRKGGMNMAEIAEQVGFKLNRGELKIAGKNYKKRNNQLENKNNYLLVRQL
jgi:transcriptional regulator GlxA family with amidase domain